MQRYMLKSKIHRAKITQANLAYEGSFTIDLDILEAADIMPYEKVSVVNINNGERFETYTIPGERGKKEFCLNGAAARKGQIGDLVIIITYTCLSDEEIKHYAPKVVLLDKDNNISDKYKMIEPNKIMANE